MRTQREEEGKEAGRPEGRLPECIETPLDASTPTPILQAPGTLGRALRIRRGGSAQEPPPWKVKTRVVRISTKRQTTNGSKACPGQALSLLSWFRKIEQEKPKQQPLPLPSIRAWVHPRDTEECVSECQTKTRFLIGLVADTHLQHQFSSRSH